jgi:uncharacterized protein
MDAPDGPTLTLTYAGANLSDALAGAVLDLTYTDVEHGESDTLEVTLADPERRWQQTWYPDLGQTLTATLGYTDGRRLDCGTFELDEVTWEAPPETVRLHAIATPITPKLRTRQSLGYDQRTLAAIVQQVASRNGLAYRGDIDAGLTLPRVTQNHERDLAFVRRLAEDYGYSFTVKGRELHCWSVKGLERRAAVLTLARTALSSATLAWKSEDTAPEGEVTWQDPQSKKVIRGTVKLPAEPGDTERRLSRAPTQGLAERQAEARLYQKDKRRFTSTLRLPGEVRLVAGVNVTLEGFYRLSGTWHVERSVHRLSRGEGYTTEVSLYRVESGT